MENFKLTAHFQFSKTCKDKKQRNFVVFFLNDIQIFKQKIPFDESYEKGFDRRTSFVNTYLMNNKMYQTRVIRNGCGSPDGDSRDVHFPVSKKILQQFEIPKDFKIELTYHDKDLEYTRDNITFVL